MTQYLSQLSLARLLAASLALGIGLGLLYDLFRIRRLAFGRSKPSSRSSLQKQNKRRLSALLKRLLLHIEDGIFGVVAGVSTVLLYFALSMGQVRFMAIIGEAVGFILYRLTLGKLIMACADGILRLLAMIFRLIVHLLILPPLRLIGRLAQAVFRVFMRACRRLRMRGLTRQGGREAIDYAERLSALAAAGFAEQAVKKRKEIDKTKVE